MLKVYFYILRGIMVIGLTGFLIVLLHILVSEGPNAERIFTILLLLGMLVSSELFHRYQMKSIARINIEGEWTDLIEVRGRMHRHKTANVVKIICTSMGGYRIFVSEKERLIEYKCTGMLTVKNYNEKKHRGVRQEDFLGVKFS